jgi:hypothetical protein
MDKRYEYRIVTAESKACYATKEINERAAEGFRVISCMCAGPEPGFCVCWVWTMEREIPPVHPYR